MIDAAALAPSAAAAAAILALATGGGLTLSFLLSVRLLTRTVKLARYSSGGCRLGLVMRQKGSQLIATVCGLLLVLVIAASLMYFAENKAQPDDFSSIPAAMWWSVVTLTTVGYGDVVPSTAMTTASRRPVAVLGIGFFALPAGVLSAGRLALDAEESAARNGRGPDDPATCPHCGRPLADNPDSG